jgi:hypothetical protein
MVSSLLSLTFNTVISHFNLKLSDNAVIQKDKTKEITNEEIDGATVESLNALFELIKE